MLQRELSKAQGQIRTLQAQLNRLPLSVLNGTSGKTTPRAPTGAAEAGGAALRHKQRAGAAASSGPRPVSPRDGPREGPGAAAAEKARARISALSEDEQRMRLNELDPAAAHAIDERRSAMEALRHRLTSAQAQTAVEMSLSNMGIVRPLSPPEYGGAHERTTP